MPQIDAIGRIAQHFAQPKGTGSIGQIDRDVRRELDREVRAGRLERWRGYWAPVAGASMGLGPLKTCWGLPSVRAVLP